MGRPRQRQIGRANAEQRSEARPRHDHWGVGADRDDSACLGGLQRRPDPVRVDGDSLRHDSVGGVLRLAGLAVVWLLTFGPVVALGCSLAAFGVIWVSDSPPRRFGGADTFVKIEELNAEDLD